MISNRLMKANRSERVIEGVVHVWSIFDNVWVTLDYWLWVNGRKK